MFSLEIVINVLDDVRHTFSGQNQAWLCVLLLWVCLSMLFGECCRKHTEKLFTKTRIRIVQLYVCGHTILIYNDNFTNNGHYNKLCSDEQWKSWKIITFNFSHENFSIWAFALFDLAESYAHRATARKREREMERERESEIESHRGHLKLISLVVADGKWRETFGE